MSAASVDFSDPLPCTAAPLFSPDGCRVLCVGEGEVSVRDTQTLQVQTVLADAPALAIARWSPDGEQVVGIAPRQTGACVWSAGDGALYATIHEAAPVVRALWAPNSSHLLLVTELPPRATAWSLLSGTAAALPAPKCSARGLCFGGAPDAPLLAMLQRQDCRDVVSVLSCADWQTGARWAAATADAEDLAFCGADGTTLALWDAAGAAVLHAIDGAPLGRYAADGALLGVRCAAWAPDASLLAVGTAGGAAAVLARSRFPAVAGELPHAPAVRSCPSAAVYFETAFTAADAPSDAAEPAAVRYTLAACPVHVPTAKLPDKAKAGVGALAWSPDGRLLATRCDTCPTAVWVWDVAKLSLAALLLQQQPVRDCAWDPGCAARLVICTGGPRLYVWTPGGASVVTVPAAPCFHAAALAFAPQGGVCALSQADGTPNAFCCAYWGAHDA